MAKRAKKIGKKAIVRTKVRMRADIKVAVGDILLYPYSSEVGAGEPSTHKSFHAKYSNQHCTVRRIKKADVGVSPLRPQIRILFKVRFADGTENELLSDAFVYIGKKKAAQKKKKSQADH